MNPLKLPTLLLHDGLMFWTLHATAFVNAPSAQAAAAMAARLEREINEVAQRGAISESVKIVPSAVYAKMYRPLRDYFHALAMPGKAPRRLALDKLQRKLQQARVAIAEHTGRRPAVTGDFAFARRGMSGRFERQFIWNPSFDAVAWAFIAAAGDLLVNGVTVRIRECECVQRCGQVFPVSYLPGRGRGDKRHTIPGHKLTSTQKSTRKRARDKSARPQRKDMRGVR